MSHTEEILDTMMRNDAFSKWLGIIVDEYTIGYCRLHYTVKGDMLNGFGIVHGGVVVAAADSAFAFACNSHGRLSVALDITTSFVRAAAEGDLLFVEAKEVHNGNKTSFYDVTTTNIKGEVVAIFRGTAYRTGKLVTETGK